MRESYGNYREREGLDFGKNGSTTARMHCWHIGGGIAQHHVSVYRRTARVAVHYYGWQYTTHGTRREQPETQDSHGEAFSSAPIVAIPARNRVPEEVAAWLYWQTILPSRSPQTLRNTAVSRLRYRAHTPFQRHRARPHRNDPGVRNRRHVSTAACRSLPDGRPFRRSNTNTVRACLSSSSRLRRRPELVVAVCLLLLDTKAGFGWAAAREKEGRKFARVVVVGAAPF